MEATRKRAMAGATAKTKKLDQYHNYLILLVPGTGLEPVQPQGRGILSPLRLPISPPGQAVM